MTSSGGSSVAVTRLHPPTAPRRLVRRCRLDDVLDVGIDSGVPLVLVSAPAGAGKSTLVASWSTGRPETVAWLQAEASDSDPARFWSYLIDALAQAGVLVAGALKPIVAASNGNAEFVVPALVNALASGTGPLLVVIDDYHLIDNAGVHRGVERLVDLCPPQVTLVLATRIDPPFRLGRLRVRGQLVELRVADLRFAGDDARGLLGSSGAALDPDLVDTLCDRTEGWAAGLVLAGLSIDRSDDPAGFVEAFRGDDQFVVEYLHDEFFASATAHDRDRLLKTSVLDQLNGSLVDALTGGSDGAQWLAATAHANQLLVSLDRAGTWFRYHHLLRDLLRMQAHQALVEILPDLHARAAAWFTLNGDHGHAIAHHIAGGGLHAAAGLLRGYGPQLLAGGQVGTLQRLLDQLGELGWTVPSCALLYGWCDYLSGRYSRAEERIGAMLAAAPDGFDPDVATSLRMNISLARGDVTPALRHARRMTASGQLPARPCDLATATGAAYAWAGQTDDARRTLRFAIEKAGAESFRTAHVLALVYLAIVEFDDSSGAAMTAASAALDTADAFGLAGYHGIAPAFAIRARHSDDPGRARADALHALELARRASTVLGLGYVLTICGDVLLGVGDRAGVPLLTEARAVLDQCPDPGVAGRYLDRAEARHRVEPPQRRVAAVLAQQLTGQELAVLRHLPSQLSQRGIAAELYLSLNTVKTHCGAIYRKLGTGNRKAAVQAARELHLL
jgi:LuxR family maltose regulon positive regulatory protein